MDRIGSRDRDMVEWMRVVVLADMSTDGMMTMRLGDTYQHGSLRVVYENPGRDEMWMDQEHRKQMYRVVYLMRLRDDVALVEHIDIRIGPRLEKVDN